VQQLRSISRNKQIACAVTAVLVIALPLVFVLRPSPNRLVLVASTDSAQQAQAWQWRLKKEGVNQTVTPNGKGGYELRVPARLQLASDATLHGGRKVPISTASRCPKSSAMSVDSAPERANCLSEAKVHDQLVLLSGVLEESGSISKADDSDGIFNSDERTMSVVIMRDPNTKLQANGIQLARMVGATVGIRNLKNITISDTSSELWPMATESDRSKTAAVNPCSITLDGTTDLNERERRLTACREHDVLAKVSTFMDMPASSIAVAAPITLDPRARHSTVNKIEPGVRVEETSSTTTTGAGKNASTATQLQRSETPTTREVLTDTQAGAISSERISVGVRGATNADINDLQLMLRNAWPTAHVQVFAMRTSPVAAALSTPAASTSPATGTGSTTTAAAEGTAGVAGLDTTARASTAEPTWDRPLMLVSLALGGLLLVFLSLRRSSRPRGVHDPDAERRYRPRRCAPQSCRCGIT